MTNITPALRDERNMATMNTRILAVGLNQLPGLEAPFTIFEPSDLAFGKLEQGIWPNLLLRESKTLFADILRHHIVPRRTSFDELISDARLTALQGNDLLVEVQTSGVIINGARVHNRYVTVINGMPHSLNDVLLN